MKNQDAYYGNNIHHKVDQIWSATCSTLLPTIYFVEGFHGKSLGQISIFNLYNKLRGTVFNCSEYTPEVSWNRTSPWLICTFPNASEGPPALGSRLTISRVNIEAGKDVWKRLGSTQKKRQHWTNLHLALHHTTFMDSVKLKMALSFIICEMCIIIRAS